MEKYPIIIEFNGLPGSGKTTLSKKIIDNLRKNNINGMLYQEYKEMYQKKLKLIDMLFFAFKLLNISNWKFLYYTFFCANKDYKLNKNRFKKTYSVLYFYINMKDMKKRSDIDVVVFDQGIVQAIISIIYLDGFYSEKYIKGILKCLNKTIGEMHIINIDLSIDGALERVMDRKNLLCKIDRMNVVDAQEMLEINYNIFDKIRGIINDINFKRLNIDGNLHIEKNASIIEDWINELVRI